MINNSLTSKDTWAQKYADQGGFQSKVLLVYTCSKNLFTLEKVSVTRQITGAFEYFLADSKNTAFYSVTRSRGPCLPVPYVFQFAIDF